MTTAVSQASPAADLLAPVTAAQRRWQGAPHTAAAVAWKSYIYWLALPAVVGWASARRLPLLRPADVLLRFPDRRRLLTFGLRPSVVTAVLPSDPLADAGLPHVKVVADEPGMLAALRESLLDQHLAPLVDAIHAEVKVGIRTLRGSASSSIANGRLHAALVLAGSAVDDIRTVLAALGIEDLIELVPGPTGELTVRRRTCCLAFTLHRPKICAGCCIRPRPGAAEGFRDATG